MAGKPGVNSCDRFAQPTWLKAMLQIGVSNLNKQTQKIVVEHDFTAELEMLDDEITPEHRALAKKALDYCEYIKSFPHVVNKKAAADFDKMITACDQIAREFSGKLNATIDFECHEASITLECLYVDFDAGEFKDTLQEMAEKALQIRFQPLTSGMLQIALIMPYFKRQSKKEKPYRS